MNALDSSGKEQKKMDLTKSVFISLRQYVVSNHLNFSGLSLLYFFYLILAAIWFVCKCKLSGKEELIFCVRLTNKSCVIWIAFIKGISWNIDLEEATLPALRYEMVIRIIWRRESVNLGCGNPYWFWRITLLTNKYCLYF